MRRKAFTLIELLLAITLFSIIAVALYSALAAGINIHKRGKNIAGRNYDVNIALQRIAHDLRMAVVMNNLYMSGQSQGLYFYSIQPKYESGQEISKITYSWTNDNDSYSLYRQKETYAESQQEEHAKGDEILDGFSKIDFAYGYLKKGLMGAMSIEWKEGWKAESLPKFVKVEISYKDCKYIENIYCPAGRFAQVTEEE